MTYTTKQLEQMLAAATPGPWGVRKWAKKMTIDGNIHQVTDSQGFPSAFVPAWDKPTLECVDGTGEAIANANLIAAAPTITAELIRLRAEVATLRASEARMREALALASNRLHRCSVDYDTGTYEFIETGEWAAEARAALQGEQQ